MYLQKGVGTETGRCFLLEESARLQLTNNKINEADLILKPKNLKHVNTSIVALVSQGEKTYRL